MALLGIENYGWFVNIGLSVSPTTFSEIYIFSVGFYLHVHWSLIQLVAYLVWLIASRTYFNPLSKYPGPFLWSFSRIPHAYYLTIGRLPFKIAEFHERYGPIVRIAPDELVFIEEEAWQDIYGKPQPRNTQLRKDPTVFVTAPKGPKGILVEPNDEIHGRLR